MSENPIPTQGAAQAGTTGQAASVGPVVGGVHSSAEHNWLDLWALNPETRAYLSLARRDAACSHASSRREGAGDGPPGIRTPAKLRHLQDTLYRKAKAEPGYRFWSLYGELTRRDLLEHALRLVVHNGGAPGVDGESLAHITGTPERQARWLDAVQGELKAKTYRPAPVRRVHIPKSNGGQRPLGIPTVKDRVVQMAVLLVLGPILEADFHPRSYGFRPGRNAHQALDEIVAALRSGRLEVVDADLSKYFDTIPHDRLMTLVAGRTSDGSLLHLIRQWLDAPVVEEGQGKRHVLPNRQGVPQGGVISPLLANLYLNALDWQVNDRGTQGQPVLVRYADDFVILCAPGQGAALRQRLQRWLTAHGLQLNEQKTRVADSRRGFQFLGFTVRWQPSRRNRRWYAHVEASGRSAQRLREAVRSQLNHWTLGQRIPEVTAGLNRFLRGWSGYFHYRQSSRVMSKLNWQVRNRLRRWLWRKHGQKRALWKAYPDERLHGQYGLWPLPTRVTWKARCSGASNAL
ncbi:MAG: group II intron reverse transcriptase/maturase [Verrucomicrobia bacterium]|nr:group II intron reverse transcriptase/maturase [Verrucomicrobiota bacterium]